MYSVFIYTLQSMYSLEYTIHVYIIQCIHKHIPSIPSLEYTRTKIVPNKIMGIFPVKHSDMMDMLDMLDMMDMLDMLDMMILGSG